METTPPAPGPRLELSQTNGDMFDNFDIVFVNDSPGGDLPAVRAKVANVPEGTFDNWPYEPNESRTFRAELASHGQILVVAVTTLKEISKEGEKVDENTYYCVSADGGGTWEGLAECEFQAREVATSPRQVLGQIAGPQYGGKL